MQHYVCKIEKDNESVEVMYAQFIGAVGARPECFGLFPGMMMTGGVAGNMGNDNYHSQATTPATPIVATLVLEVISVILLYLALNPSPKMRMAKSTAISMGGVCVSTKLVGNIGT